MFKCVFDMCDVVSHLIQCVDDNTFLVTLENNVNDYWIPSIVSPSDDPWIVNSQRDLKEIFGVDIKPDKLLRIFRVWLPTHYQTPIYHVIYNLNCNSEFKKKARHSNNKYRGKLKWLTEPELVRYASHDSLRSPEIIDLLQQLKSDPNGEYPRTESGGELYQEAIGKLPADFNVSGTLVEITEAQSLVLDSGSSIQTQLVEAAGFKRDHQCLLYREFLLHCYPSMFMSMTVFCNFIMGLGWLREDSLQLFRAADIYNRGGLSFRDFLYVLAAIDPGTSHGGGPAELRCRYIFRFYDRDRDMFLCYSEFKALVAAVRRLKKVPTDPISVSQDADSSLKDMGFSTDYNLTINDFLHAVGDLKFRGTSVLFRAPHSIMAYIQDLQEREKIAEQKSSVGGSEVFGNKPIQLNYSLGGNDHSINLHRDYEYEIAVHTVALQKSGTMINVDEVFTMDGVMSLPTKGAMRTQSLENFNQRSLSNEMLKSLRYLIQVNPIKTVQLKGTKDRKNEPVYNWGHLDSSLFCRNFLRVCVQVRDMLKAENRMLELSSPVYVLGDLHGNLLDLLHFEKILWHLGPNLSPVTLLFLGDYVDRGAYSMEVIAYLFSYKVQCPFKLFMLRGNHEIRNVQKLFTFESECCRKFGDSLGRELWLGVNNAFDTMPVAATIDGKIFCCHGGIPPPWLCPVVNAINLIPSPLTDPDVQSPLAWELMWNDPIKPTSMTETATLELMANEGFASNSRRGTGHTFSVEALERFLMINGFSHVVRAHEVMQCGFNVQQNGKLITVFSSSKYCGSSNEAACVIADKGKLRVLRLLTS